MAGRRRTGALASALDMATNLIGFQIEQQEARRRRAEEIFLKLAVEEQLNEAKRARALAQVQQGALPGTELEPVGMTDPVTGVRYATPRALDPREQLFSDIRQASEEIPRFQSQVERNVSALQPITPMRFGVSERALSERPLNINRVAGQTELQKALSRLEQLKGMAQLLREEGLIGTPRALRQQDQIRQEVGIDEGLAINQSTQATLEDLQSGAATREEFEQNETFLQQRGVDTDYIRRVLGI